jgi:hypothetical protein
MGTTRRRRGARYTSPSHPRRGRDRARAAPGERRAGGHGQGLSREYTEASGHRGRSVRDRFGRVPQRVSWRFACSHSLSCCWLSSWAPPTREPDPGSPITRRRIAAVLPAGALPAEQVDGTSPRRLKMSQAAVRMSPATSDARQSPLGPAVHGVNCRTRAAPGRDSRPRHICSRRRTRRPSGSRLWTTTSRSVSACPVLPGSSPAP